MTPDDHNYGFGKNFTKTPISASHNGHPALQTVHTILEPSSFSIINIWILNRRNQAWKPLNGEAWLPSTPVNNSYKNCRYLMLKKKITGMINLQRKTHTPVCYMSTKYNTCMGSPSNGCTWKIIPWNCTWKIMPWNLTHMKRHINLRPN